MVDPEWVVLGFMFLMLTTSVSYFIASLIGGSVTDRVWKGDHKLRDEMWSGAREIREDMRTSDRELRDEMWKLRNEIQELQSENRKLAMDLNTTTTRRVDALEHRLDRIATHSHS